MEGAAYFTAKASQCRRLAESITNPNDRAIVALIAMAEELEARAAA
jgi:hypothetical protein